MKIAPDQIRDFEAILRAPSDEQLQALAAAITRADGYMAFDGEGQPEVVTAAALATDLDPHLLNLGFSKGSGSSGATANPLDFGAVGNGTADDAAAILDALDSGEEIDGLGKTYGLSSQVNPTTLSGGGLRNARFVWLGSSSMMAQQYMILVREQDNFFFDNVWFHLGNIAATGGVDDSARGGLSIGTLPGNETTHFNTQVAVTRCRVTGFGNGTGLNIRNCDRFRVSGNFVYQRRVAAASGNPPNDCQNGIDITRCRNGKVTDNTLYDFLTSIDGNYINIFSRGIVVTSSENVTFSDNNITNVDQGMDLSGGNRTTGSLGSNRALTLSNSIATDCRNFGFKFVHGIRDCQMNNLIARGFGHAGFVLVSDTGATGEDRTGYLHFNNCHALDPYVQPFEGVGSVPAQPKLGFRNMWPTGGSTTDVPLYCTYDGCTARDSSGGVMTYGFFFESPSGYDTTALFRNCRALGFTVAEYGGGITSTQWKKL